MKRVKWLVVIFVVVFFQTTFCSGRDRARITGATQSLGTMRKAEEMYFADSNKYTDKIIDLGKYTNVTNLLKSLADEKVDIKTDKNFKYYTIIGKARDSCNSIVIANKKDLFLSPETVKCLSYKELKDGINILVSPLFFSLIICFLIILFSANNYTKLLFKSCIIVILNIYICIYYVVLASQHLFNDLSIPIVFSIMLFELWIYIRKRNLTLKNKLSIIILSFILGIVISIFILAIFAPAF